MVIRVRVRVRPIQASGAGIRWWRQVKKLFRSDEVEGPKFGKNFGQFNGRRGIQGFNKSFIVIVTV